MPDRLLAATFTLVEENQAGKDGTGITVTMSGFESLPKEARQDRLALSGLAWEKALANLNAYLDGKELPYPEGYVAALFGYRREAQAKYSVERSIWINAPRVWQAITDPKQIQKWFSPTTAWGLSALEVGGRLYVLDAESEAETHVQVIEVVDPPYQFATRALSESLEKLEEVTTYTLAEEKGGTRLTLTHSGYEVKTDEMRHQSMEQNAFGFGMMLENLQAYIEGASPPYPWGF